MRLLQIAALLSLLAACARQESLRQGTPSPLLEGAGVFEPLGDLPGDGFQSEAFDVTDDGSVVVGFGTIEGGRSRAFATWPIAPVSQSTMLARGVSADGTAIVGTGWREGGRFLQAFRWSEPEGMEILGPLPQGADSYAFAASRDGSVVVGNARSARGEEAFRWSRETGMIGLGDLPGGVFSSGATGVSADGTVIAGWGSSSSGQEAFLWMEATGMAGLGDLPGGRFSSRASCRG